MKFYIFQNSIDSRLYALTDDETGEKLPSDYPKAGASWIYWKNFESGLKGRIGFGLEDEAAAQADIETKGYYLHRRERILKRGT